MGIRFGCHHCGRRLNVKEALAGRRGVCPSCRIRFRIPNRDSPTSLPLLPTEPPDLPGQSPTVAEYDSKPVDRPYEPCHLAQFVTTIKNVRYLVGEHHINALKQEGTVGVLTTVVMGEDGHQRVISASLGPERLALVEELQRVASTELKHQAAS